MEVKGWFSSFEAHNPQFHQGLNCLKRWLQGILSSRPVQSARKDDENVVGSLHEVLRFFI